MRFQGLDWRTMTAGWTFLRSSGLPFLTVAILQQKTGQRLASYFGFFSLILEPSSAHMIASWFEAAFGFFEIGIYVHHVTDTTSRQSVQAGTDTLDGDDVQVSCAGVVCAVHNGTAVRIGQLPLGFRAHKTILVVGNPSRRRENVHWETQGHLELATGGTTTVNRALSVEHSSPCLNPPPLADSECISSRQISSFARFR